MLVSGDAEVDSCVAHVWWVVATVAAYDWTYETGYWALGVAVMAVVTIAILVCLVGHSTDILSGTADCFVARIVSVDGITDYICV